MHRLRCVAGPLAGQVVEVTEATVVGRRAADLVVDDPQVSRRHARLNPAGDALEVEDLGSLNGTWVNAARIDGPVRLAPGDQVRVGDTTFEVEAVAEVPAGHDAPATVAGPATEAARAPVPPPALPFDPPPQRPRRPSGVASRRLTPTLLSFGTVIVTAIALVLYFAMR